MRRELAPPQIHQEKREIVQDVRAGNLVVELDPVEQRWSPVQQNDVAQMEVAVTLAHEARLATLFEQRRTTLQFTTGIIGHSVGCRRFQARSPELREAGGVSLDDPCHPRLAAMIRSVFGGHVEFRDGRCQRRHELEIEAVRRCQPVEQGLLREAVHFHEPVHRRALYPRARTIRHPGG